MACGQLVACTALCVSVLPLTYPVLLQVTAYLRRLGVLRQPKGAAGPGPQGAGDSGTEDEGEEEEDEEDEVRVMVLFTCHLVCWWLLVNGCGLPTVGFPVPVPPLHLWMEIRQAWAHPTAAPPLLFLNRARAGGTSRHARCVGGGTLMSTSRQCTPTGGLRTKTATLTEGWTCVCV